MNTLQIGLLSGCCTACSGPETFATTAIVERKGVMEATVRYQLRCRRTLADLGCAGGHGGGGDSRVYDPARDSHRPR